MGITSMLVEIFRLRTELRTVSPPGIEQPDGSAWHGEAGIAPDTTARFEPKTGGFPARKITSGGWAELHGGCSPSGSLYYAAK